TPRRPSARQAQRDEHGDVDGIEQLQIDHLERRARRGGKAGRERAQQPLPRVGNRPRRHESQRRPPREREPELQAAAARPGHASPPANAASTAAIVPICHRYTWTKSNQRGCVASTANSARMRATLNTWIATAPNASPTTRWRQVAGVASTTPAKIRYGR